MLFFLLCFQLMSHSLQKELVLLIPEVLFRAISFWDCGSIFQVILHLLYGSLVMILMNAVY